MSNQTIKIIFNDGIEQEQVEKFIDSLYILLSFHELVAVSIVDEEEIKDEEVADDQTS